MTQEQRQVYAMTEQLPLAHRVSGARVLGLVGGADAPEAQLRLDAVAQRRLDVAHRRALRRLQPNTSN